MGKITLTFLLLLTNQGFARSTKVCNNYLSHSKNIFDTFYTTKDESYRAFDGAHDLIKDDYIPAGGEMKDYGFPYITQTTVASALDGKPIGGVFTLKVDDRIFYAMGVKQSEVTKVSKVESSKVDEFVPALYNLVYKRELGRDFLSYVNSSGEEVYMVLAKAEKDGLGVIDHTFALFKDEKSARFFSENVTAESFR